MYNKFVTPKLHVRIKD